MRVLYHPEFPKDARKFERQYSAVSVGLAARFRNEFDQAIDSIKSSPLSAGHFLATEGAVEKCVRRRNFRSFPFFVLYAVVKEELMFGAVIPSRSDPLSWLARFGPAE